MPPRIPAPKRPRAPKRVVGPSAMAAVFCAACLEHNLPEPHTEVIFHPLRKWRFDFCWPHHMIALEVDGAAWTQGRHTRGKGFIDDQTKGNAAIVLGWRVLHCVPKDISTGKIFEILKQVLR